MSEFITVRRNNMLLISWQIDHWVPKTRVGLKVAPDPGGGTTPIPLAPDAHTDANGVGAFFKNEMPLLGTFTYTLTIKKPQGDETRTTVVTVMDLHYRSFQADAAKGTVGKPLKLSWEIDAGEGCSFTLLATPPGGKAQEIEVKIDKAGAGSHLFTPAAPGEHTFQLRSFDPFLKPGVPVEQSPVVKVPVEKPKPDWRQVLPNRVAKPPPKTGLGVTTSLERSTKKVAPSLTYKPAFDTVFPKGAASPQDEIDAAVDLIKKARARIPPRPFHIDANTGLGNLYAPQGQGPGFAIGKDTTPEFAEFEKLRASEVTGPTGAVKGEPGFDAGTEQQWNYFKALFQAEGLPTTVTAASVDEFVTIGAGIASSGHLAQKVVKLLLDAKGTKALARAEAAGFGVEVIDSKHEFVAVDPDKKWVLKGKDADNYVACQVDLLSLIADLGIGALGDLADEKAAGPQVEADPAVKKAQIRAMLDAQFDAFKTASAPADDLKRPLDDAWVLIAHARHGGGFAGWKGDGATTADDVAHNVWAHLKKTVGAPGTSTGPLTVIRKARAVCDAFPKAKTIIKGHIAAEVDGYDYASDKRKDPKVEVTWR